ncbi:MAG: lipopolysaccharide export system permease protein [Saprospiraceae bacterium]|jgi:lipopolysaccharide export system permease protein
MAILERYLGRIILNQTMLVLLVLLGLFLFVNFLDQLSSIGVGRYGLFDAIKFVVMTAPKTIYELFPMAALLGTILGLSILANDSELIVMRSSGISIMQITRAVLKTGGIFVVIAMLIGEVVSPWTEATASRDRAEALQENIQQQTNFGLWMRDATTYVNVGEVLPDLRLLRVKVFEFDENKKLRSLVSAKQGHFDEGDWVIEKVTQTVIGLDGRAKPQYLHNAVWHTEVTPQILNAFLIQPDQLSIWQLKDYISHLKENSQRTASYELAFWNKLVLPLSTAVMVILAIPFVFANLRMGNLGRSLFSGIMLGLGFYAANKGFGYVVLAYGLSPLMGATAPVILALIIAVFFLRRVE